MSNINHPIFARFYKWLSPLAEKAGSADHREKLLSGTFGNIVEVGAGSGANFSHYPSAVSKVIAVEPEPTLRKEAVRVSRNLSIQIEVVDGTSENLPVEDNWADFVIFSLVLCSIENVNAALAQAKRVLADSGKILVYEHVRSDNPKEARRQDLVNRIWPLFLGGCNCNRDTPSIIQNSGFQILTLDSFRFKPTKIWIPMEPHVILSATAI